MIKFYTNRELSKNLEINLAKWKRWSREFLPPDPLGGKQSGYARQYKLDDAFKVSLGGHLVADLKYTIPEAKQILEDLQGWLVDKGFYFDFEDKANPPKDAEKIVKTYKIFITQEKHSQNNNYNFFYKIRGIISDEPTNYKGFQIREERYMETSIIPQRNELEAIDMNSAKMLDITVFYNNFRKKLGVGSRNQIEY